jgi:hypothetical protein
MDIAQPEDRRYARACCASRRVLPQVAHGEGRRWPRRAQTAFHLMLARTTPRGTRVPCGRVRTAIRLVKGGDSVRADETTPTTRKEGTHVKKAMIVVAVLALSLIITGSAFAFDGARDGFQLVSQCGVCHDTGSPLPNAPVIVPEWAETAHSHVGDWTTSTANQYPIRRGPACAGCHSSNYDPRKAVPQDNGTAITHYPFTNTTGDDAFSEPYVGCSACHYNSTTAHNGPYGELADAEICGQCHNRYSRNYTSYQPPASVPTGIVPAALNPSYPVGYNPFTTPLADIIQSASPTNGLGTWWSGGQSARAHGDGALQYAEWIQGGHGEALDGLKALGLPDTVAANCMECHSTDYRILEEAGEDVPLQSEAQYGITCVGCHTPHGGEETPATWNEERNAQLRMPQDELCSSCHNGHLPAGQASFEPGEEVHHPMDEVMNGRGAIGVTRMPSVHKDSCVQCHMVPTGYEHDGAAGTSANHRFAIITPEEAATQTTSTALGVKNMPYSSCSTCHGRSSDPLATYLQNTIENRQAFITEQIEAIWAELDAAAVRQGYADVDEAHAAIAEKDSADWTASELAFMSAFTNVEIVEQEGSFGIHNWPYSNAIVSKAMEQAESVKAAIADVTITSPEATVPYAIGRLIFGQSTTISGKVVLPDGASTSTLVGGQVRLWFQPTGQTAFQPVQQAFLSGAAFDEYEFKVMPARGGLYLAQFIGNDTWDAKVSMTNIGLDIAYQVRLQRATTNVKLNASVKFRGTVQPIDFPPGTQAQIQRKKGSGDWKNWVKVGVGENGQFSITRRMTATGTYRFRVIFRADADNLQGTSNTVKIVVRR